MTGPTGIDRRRAWIVAAALLAVLVVALASRAGLGDGRARSAAGVTDVVATVLEAAVLVFTVVMVGVIVALFVGGRPGGGDRRKRTMWPTIAAFALAAAMLWIIGPIGLGGDDDDQPVTAPGAAAPPPEASDGGEPDPPGVAFGAAGLAVLVLAGALGYLAVRRLRVVPVAVDVPAMPATVEERDDALAAARACTDPRAAVLLAFAAAEAVLSRDPATRRPPATSAREWAALVRMRPLDDLVGRYEVARFSHHDVTERDRTIALASLETIASEVRA